MFFNNNIKLLRQRRNRTQDVVANELEVTRSTLNSYENGSIKNPTLDMLIAFSKYFKVSIDTLVKMDLGKLSDFQLNELERGNDVYVTGARLRVLATTVDSTNRENIEVVPLKAKAGYTNGFADPEFIKKQEGLGAVVIADKRAEQADHKKFVMDEIARWTPIIKAAGVYAD